VNYLIIGQPTELELALSFSRSPSFKLFKFKVYLESHSVLENLDEENFLKSIAK